MMNCPNCQKPIREHARFCKYCGTKIAQPSPSGRFPQTVTTPTRPPDPVIGRTIAGKYELRAKLGQGGMGAVYLARRIEIDDTVAVKVLNSDLVANPDAIARFQREAQAAARLNKCSNAVTIYDFGRTEDGLVYLVMELLEGRTLRDELQSKGRLPIQHVVEIMKQVCEAVDEAHQLGIIHRDLKPDNIVLEQRRGEEIVKVVDFGIAKLREPTPGSQQLTQAGFVVGTPHYMSPEQCEGKELDPPSDIYSLGIVLYEMLTGSVPFTGTTPTGVIVQHIRDNPPPTRDVCPDISEAVEMVVMRALAKSPNSRQQSARQLALEVEIAASVPQSPVSQNQLDATQVWSTPPPQAVARKPSSRMYQRVAIGAVILILLAAAVAFLVRNQTSEPNQQTQVGTGETPTESASDAKTHNKAPEGQREPNPANERKVIKSSKTPLAVTRSNKKVEVQTTPATLIVTSRPSGCDVYMNNQIVGKTDSQGVLFVRGLTKGRNYRLRAERTGYQAKEYTLVLTSPERRLPVTLDAIRGTLIVKSTPPQCEVYLNNEPEGRTNSRGVLRISNLTLGATYRLRVQQQWYEPKELNIALNSPEESRNVTLDPKPPAILLAEAQREYQRRQYQSVINTCRRVLDLRPADPKATLLLGQSYFARQDYGNARHYLVRALALGESVSFLVKHHHGNLGFESLCQGQVTITRNQIAFQSFDNQKDAFRVPFTKLLQHKIEGSNARLHTRIQERPRKKKNYNFYSPRAQTVPVSEGSSLMNVRCNGCRPYVQVVDELISRAKGGL